MSVKGSTSSIWQATKLLLKPDDTACLLVQLTGVGVDAAGRPRRVSRMLAGICTWIRARR